MKYSLCILCLSLFLTNCQPDNPDHLDIHFADPVRESGPETWWHWLNGNISKEGITRDLEELHDKGYRGATVFSIGHNIRSFYAEGPVRFRSLQWFELFDHATKEAKRLGLKLSFHNCDGWATSGGPWVKKEDAMKELVFSETLVNGPMDLRSTIAQPRTEEGYYRDIAVVAIPASGVPWIMKQSVKLHSNVDNENLESMIDDNPTTFASLKNIGEKDEVSVHIEYSQPVEVSKLFLYHTKIWGESIANLCELFVLEAGGTYQSILQFNHRQPWTIREFKKARATTFKLVFHSFDNFSNYVLQQKLEIREFQLLPENEEPNFPQISDWDNKAGYSNFRVAGNYPPQQPVPGEKIIQLDKQVDLTDKFREGVLKWNVPSGDWKIIRLGYTLTGKPNEPATDEGRGLECDKLSVEGVEAFFSGFPEEVFQKNQPNPGDNLSSMLIDSWEAGNQNWTRDFPLEFEKRRGYSITPWLLVLAGQVVESAEASERFLWDFRRTIGDLIAENYYERMKDITNQYGVKLQAEASHVALQFMVDAINYQSKADIPMNEFWINPDEIGYNIRFGFCDAVSAAHLYDKKIVACESFTCGEGNWRHSPYWLKPAADKVFTMGVNRITFDTYTHQPDERVPGWNLAPWGVAHNRKLTWWEMEKPWIKYLTRCQYLLQKGDHIADFLIFTGEGVPSFLPVHSGKNNGIVPPGYAFDGCNTETLLKRIKVREGRLELPHGPSYRALILPDDTKMTPELAEGLTILVKKGAIIIGRKPLTSPSLQGYPECDERVREITDLAWGSNENEKSSIYRYGKGTTIQGMEMNELPLLLNLQADFEYQTISGSADLEFIHKRDGLMDIYFISNQTEKEGDVTCTFRIKNKQPEFWCPDKGVIKKDPDFMIKDDRISVPIHFEPYGSAFVVFHRELNKEEILIAENQIEFQSSVLEIADSILLKGAWEVSFRDGMGAPESTYFDELTSWTESKNDNIRYYSGTAIYSKNINIPDQSSPEQYGIYLDLCEVKELANVKINGKNIGVLWKPPYKIDISQTLHSGENHLEIEVVNTWTNRLIGDLFLPEKERHTWVNCCLPLNSSSPLMKSGLMGPVKIFFYRKNQEL